MYETYDSKKIERRTWSSEKADATIEETINIPFLDAIFRIHNGLNVFRVVDDQKALRPEVSQKRSCL